MPRRVLQGVVVSDKERRRSSSSSSAGLCTRSTRSSSSVRRSTWRTTSNAFKAGDVVKIRECRPISRRKHWEVLAEGA